MKRSFSIQKASAARGVQENSFLTEVRVVRGEAQGAVFAEEASGKEPQEALKLGLRPDHHDLNLVGVHADVAGQDDVRQERGGLAVEL